MDKRPMISIVDDDASMREATVSLMRAAGFSPEAFSCADEFLQSEALPRTECLIADVQMPGMTGVELQGRLVQSGKPIPTVFVTAYPDEKTRGQALEAGAVCFLTKPFNEDELLKCVQSALEQGNKRSESQ
jgi:FixJ family two-component response regulator